MLPQPLSSARSWKARHLCWWLGCSVVTRAVIREGSQRRTALSHCIIIAHNPFVAVCWWLRVLTPTR